MLSRDEILSGGRIAQLRRFGVQERILTCSAESLSSHPVKIKG